MTEILARRQGPHWPRGERSPPPWRLPGRGRCGDRTHDQRLLRPGRVGRAACAAVRRRRHGRASRSRRRVVEQPL